MMIYCTLSSVLPDSEGGARRAFSRKINSAYKLSLTINCKVVLNINKSNNMKFYTMSNELRER